MLILTSATHGIEGYCGSGVQVALLHDEEFLRAVRAAGVAVLLVHAVNPHGFSYGRRVNEDNVDLNRNFRDFALAPPPNARYADVHPMLLPATWPPPQENEAAVGAYVGKHGMRASRRPLPAANTHFPTGSFRRDRRHWSNRTVRSVLRRHAAGRRRVAWIDFHTALGPRGHGEKIYAGRNVPAELARARAWWGDDVTSFYDGSSTSASVVGFVTGACYDECPGAEITAMHSNTAPWRCRRCCTHCAPTTGCTITPKQPQRCGCRSGNRCAMRSTSTRTTGKSRCSERRAALHCGPSSGWRSRRPEARAGQMASQPVRVLRAPGDNRIAYPV
jgi:hypothetical protein